MITIELPLEYRRKGPGLVAIAFFQADDHVAVDVAGAADALGGSPLTAEQARDPFFVALAAAAAARHPHQRDLEDFIGGTHALIRLTAAEFGAPRIAPPAEIRPTGRFDNLGCNAWDDSVPESTVWIGERVGDMNTGIAPSEDDDGDYVGAWSSNDPQLQEFWTAAMGRSHLGGTVLPCQAVPEGLTPYVFELEDGVGGADFGGGNAQIDLESDVFDWAQ
ncbi:hypothetical protein [Embleya scabrispora]|uniref:hypothetical protein n=1 Tax=Embleya scabrispora TaxID=159449 RepID=UPI001F21D3B6|nr:hypothetical protein [Embleya scabrispora]